MRTYLIVWLALLLGSLSAQAQGWEKVKRTLSDGIVQRGWSRRNLTTFPQTTAGNANFTSAVNGGQVTIALTSPFTGPSGVKLRYSLYNNLLTLEAAGDVEQLKFERQDGTPLTGTNPDGVSLQSGVFYGYAANGSPPYTRQWKALFTPAVAGKTLKLTLKQASGSTFAYSCLVPTGGVASSEPLIGVPSATVTPPPSTTVTPPPSTTVTTLAFQIVSYSCQTGVLQYKFVSPDPAAVAVSIPGVFAGVMTPGVVASHTFASDAKVGRLVSGAAVQGSAQISLGFTTSCDLIPPINAPPVSTTSAISYNKVVVIGNSITHTVWNGNSHGMAASTPANDYFHQLTAKLQTLNPSVQVRELAHFGGTIPAVGGIELGLGDGPSWEDHFYELDTYNPAVYPGGLNRYQAVADWLTGSGCLLIIRLGENVDDNEVIPHNLPFHLKAFIDKLTSQNPACRVVLTTSGWVKPNYNAAVIGVGQERSYSVAELSGIPGYTAFQNHPNDGAMQIITNRVWEAILRSTATTPPPTTPPATTITTPFLTYTDQGWSDDLKTLENATIKVQFHKKIGGVVWWMGLKSNNRNLVQTHYHNSNYFDLNLPVNKLWDCGRSYGAAWYASPSANTPFTIDGITHTGIGSDPVWGGAINFGDGSEVIKSAFVTDPVRGTVFCEQIRPKEWDFTNKLSNFLVNHEFWIVGTNTLAHRMQVIVEPRRAGVQAATLFTGASQEEPGIYVISSLRKHLVRLGGQDFDNYPHERTGSPREFYPDDFSVGAYTDDLSNGLTIYVPGNDVVVTGRGDPVFGESGEAEDGSFGYIQNRSYRNLDIEGAHEVIIYTIIGSRATALATLPTLPQPSQDFDFDFTVGNYHSWSNGDGVMKRLDGVLTFNVGKPHVDNGVTSNYAAIISPTRRWNAADIQTIAYTGAVTGASALLLRWSRLNPDGSRSDFQKPVSVNGDGVERTYTFSTSDPNFTGTILSIGLQAPGGISPWAMMTLKRIRKNP